MEENKKLQDAMIRVNNNVDIVLDTNGEIIQDDVEKEKRKKNRQKNNLHTTKNDPNDDTCIGSEKAGEALDEAVRREKFRKQLAESHRKPLKTVLWKSAPMTLEEIEAYEASKKESE
ncbi:hypothetical protein [Clostridioides sp. ZZV14-6387]|uniref:hypothetical protein n=1 Tax=Clostridioides sp. ZZV14-6387 TaxID=2811497 RepID=UPI001D114A81|nr:hypothetical protein [Clostridioides sp. ZZV14-6387]